MKPFSDKLRPKRYSVVKECNPGTKGGRKHTGFKLFDEINDERSDEKDFGGIKDEKSDNKYFEDCSLHPNNDAILRFFKRLKENGSCLIVIPFESSSIKAIIFPT
jgi:hypothetical protein